MVTGDSQEEVIIFCYKQNCIIIYISSAPPNLSSSYIHRVVELPKTEEGLGFNVMGGKEQNSPIYISRIIPGDYYDDGDDFLIKNHPR